MTSIKCVAFTGGEPLLLGSTLYELIAHAVDRGLRTRVVTSAYWGNSVQQKQKTIDKLLSAGLHELNISTGDFHKQFVPVDQVCEVAFASALAGIYTMIAVEHHPDSTINKEFIVQKIKNIAGETKLSKPIRVLENILVPTDLEYLENKTLPSNTETRKEYGCKNICINLSLLPTEEVYACCGLTIQKIPDLKLGNLDDLLENKNERELENFLFNNLLHLWLAIDGPEIMARFVEKESGVKILDEKMEHRCHQCLAMFSSPNTREILNGLASQEKTRILLNFFQQQDFYSKNIL
jgi:organic radical activating enzyme